MRIEFLIGAHAVDLRGRRENDALFVLHARAHEGQVGFEVEFEHAQRVFHVCRWRGDRHQRQHHIAFLDVILDPLLVDGDIAFKEMKTLITHERLDAVGTHVHAVDMPIGGCEDAFGKVMADKAVDAEDEDFFHGIKCSEKWEQNWCRFGALRFCD